MCESCLFTKAESQKVTNSFHIPFLCQGHVFKNCITLFLWNLQPFPQFLDLLPIRATDTLTLSLSVLQLKY